MTQLAVIDERDITITPVFKYIEVENIPKSEAEGRKVMETHEAVEVRFAGSNNYSPVFPVDAQYKREGNQVITYAERWPDQYRAFKEGNPQEIAGTPLEMLRPYGVTPEQLSLCRARRIYSIEALNKLEGSAFKTLGMHGNNLREAAKAFLADRDGGKAMQNEIEALKAEIARLTARSTVPPVEDATEADREATMLAANEAFAAMEDSDIKDEIASLSGTRPRGNPSRETLIQMLTELRKAA